MPFFSVVIPLFNKEAQIQDSLKSVLAQNFSDFEVIIVDDGSTDRSMERAKAVKDPRISFFSQKNMGASSARNFGIEKSTSAHIALLDADDRWEPNHLEVHFESIQKFPKASLYCNAYSLKLTDNFEHKATYVLPQQDEICMVPDYFEASVVHPIAMTNTVTFKKKDFIDIKGFDNNIPSGQDIDLWIRFALKKTIVFNPTATTSYDKTIANSLSKGNYRKSKAALFNSYQEEEKKLPSLKKYLDLNRYSLAIQCKYYDDREVFKTLETNIDPRSLNFKQKALLYAPAMLVRWLKKVHTFLIKRNIYLTAYK